MKRTCVFLLWAMSAVAAPAVDTPASGQTPPIQDSAAAATLVVFNSADRDSKDLAQFYAEKRGIAKDHLIGLDCPRAEEISRDEYDRTIADPLRRALTTNFWWKLRDPDSHLGPVESNKIRFIALIRGMPLKIAQTANYPGDKPAGPQPVSSVNAAAVDSELAVLGMRTRSISGALGNPYFRSYSRIADAHQPQIMLVCRLDAPTADTVRRMITDSIAAENTGLAGFAYVDARGITDAGYADGDKWLYAIAEDARRHGSPVILDNGPELFPESYPMEHAALYFGWYADHAAGPFVRPDFRFVPGAIAVHLHSFSAATLRSPIAAWVGPLLTVGAAASLGNVYEPYLGLTPQLDVFHDRLRAGFTFAESAYMAQRALSWMTTFVGDPLYRPYKSAAEIEERPTTGEWAEYRKGARLWHFENRAAGEAALRAAGKSLRSGVILEGLGLLELTVNDRNAAIECFEQARQYYGKSSDAVRAAVHELLQLRAANRDAEALALAGRTLATAPGVPAVELLRTLESQIRASLARAK